MHHPLRPLLIALATLALGRLAHAGDAVDAGRAFYRRYCAACHGESATGDGPVAGSLGQKPTDLTGLAEQNGGQFPFVNVVTAIDGTRTVRAHGVSEMPVWGEVFAAQPSSPAEQQAATRGKIILIAEYLRSIQRK